MCSRVSDPHDLNLRRPRHRVERHAIALWAGRALSAVLPVVLVLAAGYAFWDASRPWTGPLLSVACVLGLLYVAVMPPWRYRVHRWEVTDQAVYASAGWFVTEWRIAPHSRIQTVDTVRGPLDQLLGLASLVVTTASSSGAVTIRGLNPKTAVQTAEELNKVTQNTPGDAT